MVSPSVRESGGNSATFLVFFTTFSCATSSSPLEKSVPTTNLNRFARAGRYLGCNFKFSIPSATFLKKSMTVGCDSFKDLVNVLL